MRSGVKSANGRQVDWRTAKSFAYFVCLIAESTGSLNRRETTGQLQKICSRPEQPIGEDVETVDSEGLQC